MKTHSMPIHKLPWCPVRGCDAGHAIRPGYDRSLLQRSKDLNDPVPSRIGSKLFRLLRLSSLSKGFKGG